jgi:hypothetical protein
MGRFDYSDVWISKLYFPQGEYWGGQLQELHELYQGVLEWLREYSEEKHVRFEVMTLEKIERLCF